MTDKQAVLFQLDRLEDKSGISGTGIVADGVEFPDGTVALRWRGETRSTVIYESLADVLKIHGHGGATQLKFVTKGDYDPCFIGISHWHKYVSDDERKRIEEHERSCRNCGNTVCAKCHCGGEETGLQIITSCKFWTSKSG